MKSSCLAKNLTFAKPSNGLENFGAEGYVSNEKQPVVREMLSHQLQDLRFAWAACLLAPLPAMAFWRSQDGRCVALWCFCAGCFALVAHSFRPHSLSRPGLTWRDKVLTTGAALLFAWVLFSLLWLAIVDVHDFLGVFIGFQILIPSLCVVPYLTMITRKRFAAVVLSAFLLGSMKMIAGIVVNLHYGWGDGHHEIPWTEPNLMLSAFWAAATILCTTCYFLAARRFRSEVIALS